MCDRMANQLRRQIVLSTWNHNHVVHRFNDVYNHIAFKSVLGKRGLGINAKKRLEEVSVPKACVWQKHGA